MDNAKVEQLLTYLADTVEKVGDFTAEQAPLVAQEIVAWHFWCGVMALFFGLLILVSAAVMIIVARRCADAELVPLWALTFFAFLAIGLFVVCVGGEQVLKAKIAPRIVVLDKLTK